MGEPRTVLITGSTSGLGFEAARRLAAAGHRVVVHGRGEDKARAAAAAIGGVAQWVAADLGSLAAVRELAEAVRQRFPDLDVLINNAAISNWGRDTRGETADGHELIFGTNYLSHYLLTRLLLPGLLARPAPRVVNVGARQMGAKLDWDDLEMRRDYRPMQAVLRAKLGLFFLTRSLALRHQAAGLRASALDPGLVKTPYQEGASWILRVVLRLIGKSPEQVADLYAWLAIDGDVAPEGRMYAAPGKPARWHPYVGEDANANRLWEASARLVGLDPG